MKILISGSLAYDRIMSFPDKFSNHILPEKIHILNVAFTVNGLEEKFGGTAGNIGYSLTLLGERPLILGAGGTDFSRYREWLERQGLSLEGIRSVPEVLTAGAYIMTDKSDNQITAFNPGAMNYPSLFRLDGLGGYEYLAIVAPGNLEDMQNYCRDFRERRIRYIFDPGQAITSFTGEQLLDMITGAYILISNDYELEMIKAATGLDRDELLARTSAIITTLGENGSLLVTSDGEIPTPAARAAKVIDPTGAGDSYRSGLIKGLVTGRELEVAARMGAVSASYAVEHLGTQEHCFTLEEYWSRYEENFGPL